MFFPFYILNQLKLGSNNFFLSELFPEYPSIFFPNILVGAQKCLRYRFLFLKMGLSFFTDGTFLFTDDRTVLYTDGTILLTDGTVIYSDKYTL